MEKGFEYSTHGLGLQLFQLFAFGAVDRDEFDNDLKMVLHANPGR